MRVGLAAVEITPPPNIPLDGFESRTTGSRGVHDPLRAHALVLESGESRVGWVIADLSGVPATVTRRVRELSAARIGAAADAIMVSATHTHGGPSPRPVVGGDADLVAHADWLDRLPGRLAAALMAAADGLEPATLGFGRAECTDVQHNRRFHMKDGTVKMVWDTFDENDVARLGPVDPAVQVLTIRSGGILRGVLVQFACHPTVLVGDNLFVTADWPGVMREELRSLLKAPGLWVGTAQGCCGDITPSPPRGTFPICERKGKAIAVHAARAAANAEPVRGDTVHAVRTPVKLPRKRPGLDATWTGDHYDAEVQAFRLGDLAVVGMPGEALVGIGLEIKSRSSFRGTFVGSYANDYDDAELGYIPTEAEYAGGGYEVAAARVAPGADAILVGAAREALGELMTAKGG